MSRATQWEPLCEVDPTPGDADEVDRAGRRYAAMAKEIEGQVRRLKDIVEGTTDGALQGGYVQSLTAAAQGLRDGLAKTSGRYREVGGTLQHWGPQLRDFQDEAEWLRQQAVSAAGDMAGNRVIPQMTAVDAPPPADAQVAADNARAGRYDDARADLSRAQSRLVDLRERRDAAAARIADAIRDTCDDDVANSTWDNFKDWMDEHAELVSGACKLLGVVAMAACVVALVVPGLNIAAAGVLAEVALNVAAGATLASFVGHAALAQTGNGPWLDVGMDALALATFGAGRFLGPGIKALDKTFGGALERVTAETKIAGAEARGTAARAPVRAEARWRTDVAKAQKRLVKGAPKGVRRSVHAEVRAIRAEGIPKVVADSQKAFDATKATYLKRQTPTTFLERLGKGGGDSDIAAMRAQAQDAAAGFSPTSKVGLAAAKADAAYRNAVIPTATSNATTAFSVVMEQLKPNWYENLRERTWTKEGGDL